jgi:hypothetical protein
MLNFLNEEVRSSTLGFESLKENAYTTLRLRPGRLQNEGFFGWLRELGIVETFDRVFAEAPWAFTGVLEGDHEFLNKVRNEGTQIVASFRPDEFRAYRRAMLRASLEALWNFVFQPREEPLRRGEWPVWTILPGWEMEVLRLQVAVVCDLWRVVPPVPGDVASPNNGW